MAWFVYAMVTQNFEYLNLAQNAFIMPEYVSICLNVRQYA